MIFPLFSGVYIYAFHHALLFYDDGCIYLHVVRGVVAVEEGTDRVVNSGAFPQEKQIPAPSPRMVVSSHKPTCIAQTSAPRSKWR